MIRFIVTCLPRESRAQTVFW